MYTYINVYYSKYKKILTIIIVLEYEEDYAAEGTTLEKLGISGKAPDEIISLGT